MKKFLSFAVWTALTLIFTVMISCSDSGCVSSSGEVASEEALVNIMTRTSVRDYTDASVSSATLDTLIRAGMSAPTAGNKQPWKFIVVTERGRLDSLAHGNWRMAAKAQAAIVVCGDMTNVFPEEGRDYWVQDCSAATENILLAAHAVGLGAVWCGCYPISDRVAMVRDIFDIPETVVPMSIVMLGYPTSESTPKDKYKPENIHYNKW